MVKLSQQKLFEDVLDSLEDRLRRINEDRQRLDDELTRVEEQIAGIRVQLTGLSKSGNRTPGSRVQRGSVLVKVEEFLREHPGRHAARQIADGTGQNLGSVRSILKRDDRFESDENNRWGLTIEEVSPSAEHDWLDTGGD